eukprot:TRINITY_DN7630_c0_g1_i1.p1 TRINITY_DN7630_c0_g1~~TRINITY_DN7630_c0_g1_i1.p1  ORF type:complete len:302 (+),score=72.82 TRINITY_DN7630_c0_g1_i1:17-922(+)
MKVQVNSRRGNKISDFEVSESTSVQEFKKLYARKFPKTYVERQRFTYGPAPGMPLVDGKSLSDYNIKDGDVLVFKDLGAQIGYAAVYVIEYAGPLFLYPMFYFLRNQIYEKASSHPIQFTQQIALACWTFHYAKRILETLFVHKFSHGTMPVFPNLFKNCGYYWSAAVGISYFVNHPLFTSPPIERVYLGLALFIIGELGNLTTHLMLSNLRSPGTKERKIPRGFLFNYVSCPNYFLEFVAWVGFSIMTQTAASIMFTIAGAGQMWMWAVGKHRRYRKEFDGKEGRQQYPKSRKVMFPFLA